MEHAVQTAYNILHGKVDKLEIRKLLSDLNGNLELVLDHLSSDASCALVATSAEDEPNFDIPEAMLESLTGTTSEKEFIDLIHSSGNTELIQCIEQLYYNIGDEHPILHLQSIFPNKTEQEIQYAFEESNFDIDQAANKLFGQKVDTKAISYAGIVKRGSVAEKVVGETWLKEEPKVETNTFTNALLDDNVEYPPILGSWRTPMRIPQEQSAFNQPHVRHRATFRSLEAQQSMEPLSVETIKTTTKAASERQTALECHERIVALNNQLRRNRGRCIIDDDRKMRSIIAQLKSKIHDAHKAHADTIFTKQIANLDILEPIDLHGCFSKEALQIFHACMDYCGSHRIRKFGLLCGIGNHGRNCGPVLLPTLQSVAIKRKLNWRIYEDNPGVIWIKLPK